MHIFHKWSKWEEYSVTFTHVPTRLMPVGTASWQDTELWQKRECSVCGYVQREEVRPS